jgi:predicted negative regulator of RcsB-dependent stress response
LDAFERGLALKSWDASFWEHKGDALFALCRYKHALAAYEQALKLDARLEHATRRNETLGLLHTSHDPTPI